MLDGWVGCILYSLPCSLPVSPRRVCVCHRGPDAHPEGGREGVWMAGWGVYCIASPVAYLSHHAVCVCHRGPDALPEGGREGGWMAGWGVYCIACPVACLSHRAVCVSHRGPDALPEGEAASNARGT